MRLGALSLLTLLCALLCLQAPAQSVSFNLSSSKTYAPGEQPRIHLYTHNVDALEFRVYHVNDPVKFIENLRELHSFGTEQGFGGKEQIDERTPLERFHDWKAELRSNIRDFFRDQVSSATRQAIKHQQSSLRRRSVIVNEAQFAQIPILNQSQLVARWRQLVPPTYVSDSNALPVPKLAAGLYLVEATDGQYKAYTLLIVTQLALVTRTTAGNVMAYAVDRVSGQPIGGVTVDTGFGQKLSSSATTDDTGVAQLTTGANPAGSFDNFWVVASKGGDFAAATPYSWNTGEPAGEQYAGYVFTERPVYRPTHTVHWKAILREHAGNQLTQPKPGKIDVTIEDAANKKVFEQTMAFGADGLLHGDFDLPKDASLGYYTLYMGNGSQRAIACGFHVEDYRKPEYNVRVTAAQKRVLEGATMPVTINSRYFFGEPVPNARVKYRVYQERHYWWGEDAGDDMNAAADTSADDPGADSISSYGADEQLEKTGTLDANGVLTIQVPTAVDKRVEELPDYDYTVEAGVTDAANREITGRGRFLATYSTFHIDVEQLSYGVHAGEPLKFRVTALDYDDKPVSTRVHVQLVYRHWQDGKYISSPAEAVDLTTDANGHATGEVATGHAPYSSAELHATAAAVQPGTRNPEAEAYVWILGAGQIGYDDSSQTTQLIADKKTYAPGDTAHLTLVSDTDHFHALVLTEGSVLEKRQVLYGDGKTLSIDVPITAASQPNVTVSALFIRNNTLYQAEKVLKVPPAQQQLQVTVTPAKDVLQPQQTISYDVVTRDVQGKPVSADLSFGVVDEAIYSLYPDISGDMLHVLYPQRYVSAQVDSSLEYYFSGEAGIKSPLLALRNARYRPQLAQVKPGNEKKPRVRKAFPDTAYWASDVHTDATGHARVSFAFPDSLTTWRATVHAVTAQTEAGSVISRVLVRKDVLVRMGTPRFLIKGDEIVVPVIAHNYLENTVEARLSLKADGLEVIEGSDQTVAIPSKGEATANWRLRATHTGTARLTASAITGQESDALELSFPVNPAGVAETVAHSGVIDQSATSASASIVFPPGTETSTHALKVELSPSIAGSLFSALNYLTSFPYGCTEQTMSSYLPNVIVAGTLKQLNLKGRVDEADLHAKMLAGLDRLKDYQHEDGGWGWWKEDSSQVFLSAYVVGGLGQGAQVAPLDAVHQQMLRSGMQYLHKALDEHPKMRPGLRAAVVYALAEAGDGKSQVGTALDAEWNRRNELEPEALAMVGLAMLKTGDARAGEVARLLATRAHVEGELTHWTGSYVPLLDVDYNNDSEATAYAVRLLAKINSGDPTITKAAEWLMAHRDQGFFWESTEQTAMVLFGLVDYLAASHELTADYTVDVLLNGHSVGQRHFTPADATSGASFTLDLPAQQLAEGTNTVQIVRSSGNGHIYWVATGDYYSTDRRDYQAGNLALNLTRDYFKLVPTQKDSKIVYTLQPINGKAQIGDVLAVHEAINGSSERYLLLEDPIPAGTEFISNEESYPLEQRPGGWYSWYTRREFHDDHAAFFSSTFGNRQEIFYLIRVVNPGSFVISPARVRPMYEHGIEATSDQLHLDVPAPAAPPDRRPKVTSRRPTMLREAFTLLRPVFLLKQIALTLAVSLLAVLWINLPDANILEVALSAVLAFAIVLVAGCGESALWLQLAGTKITRARLLRGLVFLVVAVALWWFWWAWCAGLGIKALPYLGLFNSRLPHQLRTIFTYQHLSFLFDVFIGLLTSIGAGLLVLFAFVLATSQRPARALARAATSSSYWLVLLAGCGLVQLATSALLRWQPGFGHGVAPELISIGARLLVVTLLNFFIACLLFAVLAVAVRRTEERYGPTAGTPDRSQPRTADAP